ncbi:MAG: hypothetical protein ACOYKE_10730, partial [Ferruginibacter sp.]
MKHVFYILVVLFAVACTDTTKSKNTAAINKNLGIEDMPNPETTYDTIVTQAVAGNGNLLHDLKVVLEKHHFSFNTEKEIHKLSYNNCAENKVLRIMGLGIKQYFARSSKPERKTKNFYPDF